VAGIDGAANCVSVQVWVPTVIVAVRDAPVVLAWHVTVTVPLPVPLAGLTTAHVWLLEAVQVAAASAVTATFAAADAAYCAVAVAGIEGAAACVSVQVCVPTVIVAVRVVIPGLAWHVTTTVPLPLPLAGLTTAHVWLLEALQETPVVAVTPILATDEALYAALAVAGMAGAAA